MFYEPDQINTDMKKEMNILSNKLSQTRSVNLYSILNEIAYFKPYMI